MKTRRSFLAAGVMAAIVGLALLVASNRRRDYVVNSHVPAGFYTGHPVVRLRVLVPGAAAWCEPSSESASFYIGQPGLKIMLDASPRDPRGRARLVNVRMRVKTFPGRVSGCADRVCRLRPGWRWILAAGIRRARGGLSATSPTI